MREEAERAEPVVDREDDNAVRRKLGAVVVAAGVLGETSAVDPHEHGPAPPPLSRTAGMETFIYRQSSLTGPGGKNGLFAAGCGQLGPNCVGSGSPVQGAAGSGGRHRRFPVGGVAYGSPRKEYAGPRTGPCGRRPARYLVSTG